MSKHDFIADLIIDQQAGYRSFRGDDAELQAAVQTLDQALASPRYFETYMEALLERLGPLHRIAPPPSANHQPDYLVPLSNDLTADLLAAPLQGRESDALRRLIPALALNVVALTELRRSIEDEAPVPWLELMTKDGERERLRLGAPMLGAADLARALGIPGKWSAYDQAVLNHDVLVTRSISSSPRDDTSLEFFGELRLSPDSADTRADWIVRPEDDPRPLLVGIWFGEASGHGVLALRLGGLAYPDGRRVTGELLPPSGAALKSERATLAQEDNELIVRLHDINGRPGYFMQGDRLHLQVHQLAPDKSQGRLVAECIVALMRQP